MKTEEEKRRVTREEREDEVPNKERGEKRLEVCVREGKSERGRGRVQGREARKPGGGEKGKRKREGARGHGQPPSQHTREGSVRRLGLRV